MRRTKLARFSWWEPRLRSGRSGRLVARVARVSMTTHSKRRQQSCLANAGAPEHPEIGYHLAVAFYETGGAAVARKVLEAVLGSDTPFDDRKKAGKLYATLSEPRGWERVSAAQSVPSGRPQAEKPRHAS